MNKDQVNMKIFRLFLNECKTTSNNMSLNMAINNILVKYTRGKIKYGYINSMIWSNCWSDKDYWSVYEDSNGVEHTIKKDGHKFYLYSTEYNYIDMEIWIERKIKRSKRDNFNKDVQKLLVQTL